MLKGTKHVSCRTQAKNPIWELTKLRRLAKLYMKDFRRIFSFYSVF